MEPVYIKEQVFEKINFREKPLAKGEYESCRFKDCNFSNSDLSDIKFSECDFKGCDLSLVKLINTSFRDITFTGCKMLGLHYHTCYEFGLLFRFEDCIADHSSFYRSKIKKTIFRNSQLRDVDFTDCDLTSSVFDSCDLLNARFEKTIIEKADFRTAFNYSIDPNINLIKKAKFSSAGIAGLLNNYDIEIDS